MRKIPKISAKLLIGQKRISTIGSIFTNYTMRLNKKNKPIALYHNQIVKLGQFKPASSQLPIQIRLYTTDHHKFHSNGKVNEQINEQINEQVKEQVKEEINEQVKEEANEEANEKVKKEPIVLANYDGLIFGTLIMGAFVGITLWLGHLGPNPDFVEIVIFTVIGAMFGILATIIFPITIICLLVYISRRNNHY